MHYLLKYKGNVILGPISWFRSIFSNELLRRGIHIALPTTPVVGVIAPDYEIVEQAEPTPVPLTLEERKKLLIGQVFGIAYSITEGSASQYSPTEKSDWTETKDKAKKDDTAFFEQFVQGCSKTTASEYMAKVKIMTLQLETLKAAVISARNRHLEEIDDLLTVEECKLYDVYLYWPEA